MSQVFLNCALQAFGHGIRALVGAITKDGAVYVNAHLNNMQRCIDEAVADRR